MKNSRGYTLLDALTALSILSILSASVLPLYTHIYEERSIIRERKEATILLGQFWNELVLEEMTPPLERVTGDVPYTFEISSNQLCVSFQGTPRRNTVICRSLPHEE
ncbi:type II secretion system protein [Bacillus sp. NTK071]|uniref:type II secretion system protein n=1 Tax=Bacillus sp. NTK071 TaxID=2802175 RepID=UPI001A900203|nr:type II secretion system protein [Bacillus sp. NTK071]MBN8208250.1 type II secretion system protein [Bacillus sp. NTK071]